jgi:hypothetical protein
MEVAMKATETTGTVDIQRQLVLATSANPAFDFLKESEEDIYTFVNGRPFYNDG